jgi:hypothetical protein
METLSVSAEQHRRSLEAHMRDIALIGRMGSGKDTVAARLCEEHGYTRLAFADAVREMALAINPLIPFADRIESSGYNQVRLSVVVDVVGWDRAKRDLPEVRRLLQNCGVTVRSYDPEFWIKVLRTKWAAIDGPVVITDCRFRNEYHWVHALGADTVRVCRPGTFDSEHVSETELDNAHVTRALHNIGSIAELHTEVDRMVANMSA